MGLQKNVGSQKWLVFAFDRTDNTPKAGDAANITAKIRKDYAAAAATNDTNPTEIEDGYYEFDLTQAESNADVIDLLPESSTADVQVIGVPARIFTVPENFSDTAIDSNGVVDADMVKISRDTTAADNCERWFDGTGYTSTNSGITTVTTVTNQHTLAEINTQVDTALSDIGLDHLFSAAITGSDVFDNSAWAKLWSNSSTADFDDGDHQLHSLKALRERGDSGEWGTQGESNPVVLQSTTIATLSSQTSFTLTAGSADDDAYNNQMIIVTDSSTSTQKAPGWISDYTGSTKTVTLQADPGVFTMATGDSVDIIATPLQLDQSLSSGTKAAQIANGTCQSGSTSSTIVLASSTSFADDLLNDDAMVVITGGTGAGQTRLIIDWVSSTDTATVHKNWTTTPDNTSTYDVYGVASYAAIVKSGLDHIVENSVSGIDVADDSVVAKIVSASAIADFDDFNNTTESLQAFRDTGVELSTTGINQVGAIDSQGATDTSTTNIGPDIIIHRGTDESITLSVSTDIVDLSSGSPTYRFSLLREGYEWDDTNTDFRESGTAAVAGKQILQNVTSGITANNAGQSTQSVTIILSEVQTNLDAGDYNYDLEVDQSTTRTMVFDSRSVAQVVQDISSAAASGT